MSGIFIGILAYVPFLW